MNEKVLLEYAQRLVARCSNLEVQVIQLQLELKNTQDECSELRAKTDDSTKET